MVNGTSTPTTLGGSGRRFRRRPEAALALCLDALAILDGQLVSCESPPGSANAALQTSCSAVSGCHDRAVVRRQPLMDGTARTKFAGI